MRWVSHVGCWSSTKSGGVKLPQEDPGYGTNYILHSRFLGHWPVAKSFQMWVDNGCTDLTVIMEQIV